MTRADEAGTQHAAAHAAEAAAAPAAPPADPSLVALPTFAVGAISLALYLLGYLPATAAVSIVPAVLIVAGLGLFIAGIWAAALAQSMVAGIFVTFAGFWSSFGVYLLGTGNGWLGVTEADTTAALATFLISWLAVFVVLTLVTLRLPGAFTLLFVLVDITFAFVLAGTLQGSTTLLQIGGVATIGFTLVGAYLLAGSASVATGGRALPVGPPLLKS